MEKRFHGIDLHKRYATITIRDEEGSEIKHISKCADFRGYVATLAVGDYGEYMRQKRIMRSKKITLFSKKVHDCFSS